jgi:ComF family protein
MSSAFTHLWSSALDLVLPHICPSCEQVVAARGLFCASCFGRVTQISKPFCHCCGVPFESHEQTLRGLCEDCTLDPPEFTRARAAFLYDRHSRDLVLGLKHSDRTDLARTLAPFLARAGRELLAESDLLVPVPLHRGRLIARRYNQSGLLAQALGRVVGKPVLLDGLIRLRATKSLGHMGRDERAAELAGAFAANPARAAAIAGARVLLIDDVMTTGATVRGCAAALRAVGAMRVDVLAVARAVGLGP